MTSPASIKFIKVAALGSALTMSASVGVAANKEIERLFTLRVKPMLMEKCMGCHGDPNNDLESGFDVSTRELFLQGGDAFDDVLVPGDPELSFIMEAVRWEDPDFERKRMIA